MIIPWAERGPPTKLPPAQLADRLVQSWTAETGSPPSRAVAELLLAQVILETDWSRAMWRFNWGNITAGSSWGGDAWRPSWFELTPDSSKRERELHALMLEGKAPSAFRAYLSHDAGSRDYLGLLRRRFAPILVAAETGDPVTFAEAVRSTRYCPDCGAGFARSIALLQAQIRAEGWFSGLAVPSLVRRLPPRLIPTAVGAMALAAAAGYGAFTAITAIRERR